MPLLQAENVNCYYGKVQVLWDITLNVLRSEVVAVIGSNGAGKTTLLRAISGLKKVVGGSIHLNGERIDTLPSHRILEKGVSQIPEGGGIFPYMTVIENLVIGAYSKRNWKSRNENIEKVFLLFPILRERKKQIAGTLSGGERQMLGVGKGMMSSPELLIFDEPSLGLSPMRVISLLDSIREISKSGVTVLIVEQNVHHAIEMSDRAYVIENGRIIKENLSQYLLDDDYVKRTYLGI